MICRAWDKYANVLKTFRAKICAFATLFTQKGFLFARYVEKSSDLFVHMSDSDDDFLPDNSAPKKVQPKPSSAQAPSSSLAGPSTPASVLDLPPGMSSNENYASSLLAARRRGLAAQPKTSTPLVVKSEVSNQQSFAAASSSMTGSAQSQSMDLLLSKPTPAPARPVANLVAPYPAAGTAAVSQHSNEVPSATFHQVATPQLQSLPAVAVAAPADAPSPSPPVKVLDAARIDQLRTEVAQKKRALALAKDKEEALLEKLRVEKAKIFAELSLVESTTKKAWSEFEDEKAEADRELSILEAEQERFVREERRRIEEEVARNSEPQIKELQEKIAEMQSREQKLRQSLSLSATSKDVVNTAVSSAVVELLSRIKHLFDDNVSRDAEWETSIKDLIRKEVQSSFAASVSSEVEAERREYQKSFQEMLQFWRDAEDEERRQITKMDEQLLLDLKSMAHDDLDRLEREEMNMEEVYMSTRESWMKQHKDALQSELEAALQRRTAEMEDLRLQKQQLHVQRMQEIETKHKDRLAFEREIHEQRMQLLRDSHIAREAVYNDRQKMTHDVRAAAARSSETLHDVVKSVTTLLDKVEEYKGVVDNGRKNLDAERHKNLQLRESTLAEVQKMVVSQATSVESERHALSSALVKLEVIQGSVEQQLEQERTWIAQLAAKMDSSRQDWDREYRRWQHIVAQEKQNAEERFSNVIMELRQGSVLLDEENAELEIEANTLRRHCAERSNRAAAELAELQKKEDSINERYMNMLTLLSDLEEKGRSLASEWQALHDQRQSLALQRQELTSEEQKMELLAQNMTFMKAQVDAAKNEVAHMTERTRALQQNLSLSREAANSDLRAVKAQSEELLQKRERVTNEQRRVNDMFAAQLAEQQRLASASVPPPVHRQAPIVGSSGESRLPTRLLGELKQLLQNPAMSAGGMQRGDPYDARGGRVPNAAEISATANINHANASHHDAQPVSRRHADPNTSQVKSAATRHDATSASSYHFTKLVGVSDAETTTMSHSS